MTLIKKSPDACPSKHSELSWSQVRPTESELFGITLFADFMKETLPECIELLPPNCVSALVHWRLLAALLVLLPPTISLHLHIFDQMCNCNGVLVEEIDFGSSPIYEFADAHMHLDKFITDMGHKGMLSRI